MVIYILVFVAVVTILVAAVGPAGFLTTKIDQSLNEAVTGSECMTMNVCFDAGGCPSVCGNGCCETGSETPSNCPADCACTTDASCDDGNDCNGTETCGAGGTCQSGTPITCDDGLPCTTDTCNPVTGQCQFTAARCDDRDPCTIDSCDARGMCQHTPMICDDGDACNGLETCSGGVCQAGTPMNCNDGNACNGIETCSQGRCLRGTPLNCDDGNACNGVETCSGGTCQPGTPIDCDDGQFCNGQEFCSGGACQAGTPVNPDDGVACTIDACDEVNDQVVNTPNDAFCDNGIACDGIETCDRVGGCQPGVGTCGPCPAPEGGTIPNGGSRVYYQLNVVPFGQMCVSEVRMCVDQNLTGSFIYPTCCVQVECGSQCGVIPDGCGGTLDCGGCFGCAGCPSGGYSSNTTPNIQYCNTPPGQTGFWRHVGTTTWLSGTTNPPDPFTSTDPVCQVSNVTTEWQFR